MEIDIDLNEVIGELLEKNKALTLENILLRKALEKFDNQLIGENSQPI